MTKITKLKMLSLSCLSALTLLTQACRPTTADSETKSTDGIGGRFEIINWKSNLCLDLFGKANHNGAEVKFWPCNKGWNQMWHMVEIRRGEYVIKSEGGRCLDVDRGDHSNNARFIVHDCHYNNNQVFWVDKVKEAEADGFQLVNRHTMKILNQVGNSVHQAERWTTGDDQIMKFRHN